MKINHKTKVVLILFFIIAFFLVLNFTSFSKEVKNFFYLISLPIEEKLWEAGKKTSDFFDFLNSIQDLNKENQELKLENKRLLAENASLRELKKENEILRETLEVGLEKEFELELAYVIAKDISQDFILIDKGLKDGISKDLPVVTGEKILVGKTAEIYDDFSKVMLISNKESSFDSKISGRDVFGIVRGKGNSNFSFELVPKEEEIKEGELLITSQLGGIFPQGLLVGKIKKVEKTDTGSFQKAEVFPLFGDLEILFIIKD